MEHLIWEITTSTDGTETAAVIVVKVTHISVVKQFKCCSPQLFYVPFRLSSGLHLILNSFPSKLTEECCPKHAF